MFYIKEAAYRSQYIFLSIGFTMAICFSNKNTLLFLLTQSVVSFQNQGDFLNVDHFIYTHPLELFTVQIFLILYFTVLFICFMISWSFVDFLKPSFILLEYRNLCKIIFFIFLLIVLLNKIFCFNLFPSIWFFFQNFNQFTDTNKSFSFFLELRIYEYFFFLTNFIYLINISLGLFAVCIFLFAFPDFKNLVYWKKLFIFLNMVFATLLSPPDVSTQIFIFVFLTLLFEFVVFICLFYIKLKKYLSFNMVTY